MRACSCDDDGREFIGGDVGSYATADVSDTTDIAHTADEPGLCSMEVSLGGQTDELFTFTFDADGNPLTNLVTKRSTPWRHTRTSQMKIS
ncbi:MAG: hypothetical protein ACJAYU_002119 [Bradymonadia bacterium]